MADFVSPESFQKALQGQGVEVMSEIGRRLERQHDLLTAAHQKVLAERRALLQEGADLHARIEETIRVLSTRSAPDAPGFDWSRLVSYFVEPCIVDGPASPVISVAGSPRRSLAPTRRGPAPFGEEGSEQEAVHGVAELGTLVGRQFSDAWSALAQGEIFDLQCTRGPSKCCAIDALTFAENTGSTELAGHQGGSPHSASMASEPEAAGAASGDDWPVTTLPSGVERRTSARPQREPRRAASGLLPPLSLEVAMRRIRPSPTSSPTSGFDSMQSQGHGSMRSVRSVQKGEEPALGSGVFETVLIEASLQLDGAHVGVCQLGVADSCKAVAARFVADHSLKPCFEAPLAEYLLVLEAESDEFPVFVSEDLGELRTQCRAHTDQAAP